MDKGLERANEIIAGLPPMDTTALDATLLEGEDRRPVIVLFVAEGVIQSIVANQEARVVLVDDDVEEMPDGPEVFDYQNPYSESLPGGGRRRILASERSRIIELPVDVDWESLRVSGAERDVLACIREVLKKGDSQ